MRVKAGRNLLLPVVKDFDNMGLRRAHKYELLTYEKLLEKHGIEDSLATATSDYAKKIYNYVRGEVFLVPSGIPLQDWEPIKQPGQLDGRAIIVGKEGLLEKFAQLLYPAKWEIPEDGSIGQYLDNLNSLPEQPGVGYEAKALEWTNKYGLLFSEPMPQSLIENVYEPSYLPFSDALYNHICAEKKNIPYFLGLKAFCELNKYVLRMLFETWLYSQEEEILNIVSSIHGESQETPASEKAARESITEGYRLLSHQKAEGFDQYFILRNGKRLSDVARHRFFKEFAFHELTSHMSVWIKLEISAHIVNKGAEGKIFAVSPQYQCSSLFAIMMIEALSGLNNVSRYRVCNKCKNIFDIGNGRSDRKYCSEECKELARYKREKEERERKKREREERRSQN